MDLYDLRTRTTLVCGALALAIAVSAVLRVRVRKTHLLLAGLSADIGFWYLSQSLFGFFQGAAILGRLSIVLAVLLPVFAAKLFEALVPDEEPHRSHAGRISPIAAAAMMALALTPALQHTMTRVAIFAYEVLMVAGALFELGQRGKRSRSRAIQRRVRVLVVIGALAGLFSVADFAWVIGYEREYYPPPVGVLLSVVFLFLLAQALRHERLLDVYEMVGRTVVATAVAFVIAGVFYLMVTVIGQFNTMWLNAIMVAIVVLVLFNPLRDWVEDRIQRFVFRERRRLEASIAWARRRLAHTLELEDLASVVTSAFERSRSVTSAALYLATQDGSVLERLTALDGRGPPRIEVAAAKALLDQLEHGSVVLEQVRRDAAEGRRPGPKQVAPEALLAAAEVLGSLGDSAVLLAIRTESSELVGLLVVADERVGDAFSPEDIALLESLASQIGVVIENSQLYTKMKERDRLAVLGQMAAGLAHEIRNPLGAIKGAAQLLAEPGPDVRAPDDATQEFLSIILEEVDRLDAVVGSVLDLARKSDDAVQPIDVNSVVRRSLQVMSAEWDNDEATSALVIGAQLDEDLPRAAIAPDQLRQVLINLLKNAAQAVGPEGSIDVRTRTLRRGDAAWVDISVKDDGPGIAASQLGHIFLPFYTTKDAGTGLGLAICQRIVQDAGGRIDVRSREGEGTTFHVVLPAGDALATPLPAAARSMPPPSLPDIDSEDGRPSESRPAAREGTVEA